MDSDLVQVTTTAPDEEIAGAIATALLEAHLAACVQILGPMQSRYWWNGAIESATEWLCVAKTTAALADRVVDAIRIGHPYDVPEVLVSPVIGALADYAGWVAATTRDHA